MGISDLNEAGRRVGVVQQCGELQSGEFIVASMSEDECFEREGVQCSAIRCTRGDRFEILFNATHVGAGEKLQWTYGCFAEISREGELVLFDAQGQCRARYQPSANPIVLIESNANVIWFDRHEHLSEAESLEPMRAE